MPDTFHFRRQLHQGTGKFIKTEDRVCVSMTERVWDQTLLVFALHPHQSIPASCVHEALLLSLMERSPVYTTVTASRACLPESRPCRRGVELSLGSFFSCEGNQPASSMAAPSSPSVPCHLSICLRLLGLFTHFHISNKRTVRLAVVPVCCGQFSAQNLDLQRKWPQCCS